MADFPAVKAPEGSPPQPAKAGVWTSLRRGGKVVEVPVAPTTAHWCEVLTVKPKGYLRVLTTPGSSVKVRISRVYRAGGKVVKVDPTAYETHHADEQGECLISPEWEIDRGPFTLTLDVKPSQAARIAWTSYLKAYWGLGRTVTR